MALTPEDLAQIVEAIGPMIEAKSNETLNKAFGPMTERFEKKVLKAITPQAKVEETEAAEEKISLKTLHGEIAQLKADKAKAERLALKSELKSTMASVLKLPTDSPHLDVYADRYLGKVGIVEDQAAFKTVIDGEVQWVPLADGLRGLADNELKHLVTETPKLAKPSLPQRQGAPKLHQPTQTAQRHVDPAEQVKADTKRSVMNTFADMFQAQGLPEVADSLRGQDEE